MATRSRKQQQTPPPEPRLTIPLARATRELQERIELGHVLQEQVGDVRSPDDLKDLRFEYSTWDEYNKSWLDRFVGEAVATEYRGSYGMVVLGQDKSLQQRVSELNDDFRTKLRRLVSIRDRLAIWSDEEPVGESDADTEGPVFIVHGSRTDIAERVARMVERSTGRDAVILHEQPNEGRTLIEKFEAHATAASFAVVVLTGDDEGRKRGGDDVRPRGRQNVVLELGFFIGRLTRKRVVVLTEPDVERPSDIDGLVYVELDEGGKWKQELARDLAAAGIRVDVKRIP